MPPATPGWVSLKWFSQRSKVTLSHHGNELSGKLHCLQHLICHGITASRVQGFRPSVKMNHSSSVPRKPTLLFRMGPSKTIRIPFYFFPALCSPVYSWIYGNPLSQLLGSQGWATTLDTPTLEMQREKRKEEEEEGRKVPSTWTGGWLDLTGPLRCSMKFWPPESRATVTNHSTMIPVSGLLCTLAYST